MQWSRKVWSWLPSFTHRIRLRCICCEHWLRVRSGWCPFIWTFCVVVFFHPFTSWGPSGLSSVFCDYKSCCCEYMYTAFLVYRRLYFSWGNTQEWNSGITWQFWISHFENPWSVSQSGCVPTSNIWGARWFCLLASSWFCPIFLVLALPFR